MAGPLWDMLAEWHRVHILLFRPTILWAPNRAPAAAVVALDLSQRTAIPRSLTGRSATMGKGLGSAMKTVDPFSLHCPNGLTPLSFIPG